MQRFLHPISPQLTPEVVRRSRNLVNTQEMPREVKTMRNLAIFVDKARNVVHGADNVGDREAERASRQTSQKENRCEESDRETSKVVSQG